MSYDPEYAKLWDKLENTYPIPLSSFIQKYKKTELIDLQSVARLEMVIDNYSFAFSYNTEEIGYGCHDRVLHNRLRLYIKHGKLGLVYELKKKFQSVLQINKVYVDFVNQHKILVKKELIEEFFKVTNIPLVDWIELQLRKN